VAPIIDSGFRVIFPVYEMAIGRDGERFHVTFPPNSTAAGLIRHIAFVDLVYADGGLRVLYARDGVMVGIMPLE
jgi:hypothetical protein